MKIEVNDLSKYFGSTIALNHVSFTLDEPKIYGLLGRNGAGKTTFMEILSGHILASEGEILIDGENPFDNQRLTESICLIKEGDNFKKDLKVKNVLRIYSYFYPTWDQQLADELVQAYNLNRNAKVKALSKGMASALGIIVGLASKVPITIFDEPYIGLDAAARKKFYLYVSDYRHSITIFWTILMAILIVSLWITYFLAGLNNEDTFFTLSLTGPMYVYCGILGFLMVKESVPFSIKMGATRKNLFISLGLFFLLLSFAMSVAASILQELVMALMNATGLDMFTFLHPAYFLDDTWHTRIIMDTSIMFFAFAVLFVIGLLFFKYGLAGGGSVLGVALVVLFLGSAQGWLIEFVIDVFTEIDLGFFYQLFGIGIVIYGISFMFLGRITTVKVR